MARDRAGLLLLAALVAVPLLLLSLGAWLAWRDAWRMAAADLHHTTEAVTEYGQRVLSAHAVAAGRVDAVLRGLSDTEIRAREADLHAELRDLVAELPQAEAAFVIDRDGHILLSANVFPVPRGVRTAADRDFFIALQATDAPAVHVSQVYTGRLDGSLFFAVSRRRTRTGNAEIPPGDFDGLVNLSVYPNRLAEGLRSLAFREGDALSLIRADGEILARSIGQSGPVRIGTGGSFSEFVASGADRALYEGISAVDGAAYLIAVRRVPGWPVHASAARPRAAIIAAWRETVAAQLAIGVPATLALLLLAGLVRRGQARLRQANQGLESRVATRTADLSASEARFRGTFDQAAVGIAHVGLDGTWIRVNSRLCGMLGYSEEELLARSFQDLTHPDDLNADLGEAARLLAGEIATYTLRKRYRRGDGTWLWGGLTVSLLRDATGGAPLHFISVVQDVTEAVAAEAALAEDRLRLRSVFTAIDQGFCVCEFVTDAQGRGVDYRFLEVNPVFETMTGLKDPVGHTALELVPGLERHWIETYARVAFEGETTRFEQGSEALGRWYDVFATPVPPRGRFALVFRDVTDRRRAERALADSEAKLRTIVETVPVGLLMAELPSGRIVGGNSHVERMLGQPVLQPAGIRGHGEWVSFHADGSRVDEHEYPLARMAQHGEENPSIEVHYQRGDGSRAWTRILGRPVRDAEGRLVGGVVALVDVDAERRALEALTESEGRLRRVLDNIFAFVGVLSPDGSLEEANSAPLAAAGLTLADVRGKPFWECFWWSHDPELQAWLRAACAHAAAGETVRREVVVRIAGDARMTIDFQIAPLRDSMGRITHLIPSAVDVTERSAAEAALATREALLSAVGASTPDVIFAKDAAGRYVYANRATLDVFGRPAGEVLGRRDDELLTDAEATAILAATDRRVRERGTAEVIEEEVADARHGGERRVFLTTKAPMRDPAGHVMGVVGVARDVTEERAAGRALAEAKERLEVVLDGAGLGSWHWHVPTGRVSFDTRWAAMLGYDLAEIEPHVRGWERLIHPDDRPGTMAAVSAHLQGRTAGYECEHRLRHKDGHWVWVLDRGRVVERDADGRAVVATGTHLDITARREAERALAASERRLALASAAARVAIWDFDAASGTGAVSAEYWSLYGLPPSEAVTMEAWLACIHPQDRDRVAQTAADAISSGGEYADEFRILRADTGEERWVEARGRSLREGGRQRLVGVNQDVTERRAEGERQTLLAREVDHRAKNVLAVVLSIVRLTRADDPRSFAEAVEGRVAALARAHTLLARDRWTGALLSDVIHEELAAYGTGRIQLAGPALRLRPDAVQPVSIVLHELATNAAKYGALSQAGGRVEITWEVEAPGPPEARANIGAAFRLHWAERGGPPLSGPPKRLGFGSTVVRATLQGQLDGEAAFHWDAEGLRVEISVPDERALLGGSTQDGPTQDGPAQDGAPPNAQGSDAPAPAGVSLQGKRVLVIEDEPLVAIEAAALLAELGCDVAGSAGTLKQALRLAALEGARLDAAVLDVNLQGTSSFPVADLLASLGVPVIYVTGYGELPEGRGGDGAGLLLRKPLNEGELAAALRHVLADRPAAESPNGAAGS